jgi:radical SAM-linked protein
MWERALRRSRLPLAYSQGFVPHPLVSFGLALPTGCESLGEYLDLRLEPAGPGEIPLAELPGTLSALLPEGIVVQAAALIADAEGSLQQEVASCDWELEVLGVRDEELQERVEKVLAAPMLTVSRERKGRHIEDDIRPAIRTLSLTSPNGHVRAELATHPRGVRPGDLVAALGAPAVPGRACRTHQWIERDGARFEPLLMSEPGTDGDATQHARRAFPHVRDGIQPEPGGSPSGATGGQQQH